jgi:hypothetical protein
MKQVISKMETTEERSQIYLGFLFNIYIKTINEDETFKNTTRVE